MKKKYTMTLLEIMIVIFIIGIIGSVIGYNMRGSLDQGKAFKTKEAARKLYEIVLLEEANGNRVPQDANNPYEAIKNTLNQSDLVRRSKDLLEDGWGNPFAFDYDAEHSEWRFTSEKYNAYCEKKGITPEYPWDEEDNTLP
ncbi:MAG: hypothetical protein AB7N99_01630 [Simkaniaceae bacterium]|jgi:general secretion pathway protein G|nr:general secretion pathway protein GspG [Chlamydiia bacterium]